MGYKPRAQNLGGQNKMTLDNKTLLDELFQRYGHPSQEADFRINGYFRKAESLNKPADVRREDERADRMIEEL